MEPLKVVFFPDGAAGPVQNFLESLFVERPQAYVKLAYDLDVLSREGLRSARIVVRPMGQGLWELKRLYDGVQYRLFFCVDRGCLWLLHAIRKKSAKTPRHDLDLARRRMRSVIE
jgi:phage-related protein